MISKEEIKKAKAFMVFYKNYCLNKETANMEIYETVNDEEFVYKNIETILQYLTQLESDKQKLIEKLEKDVVNITKTLQDGKHRDDYSRCRLKAYRTKTNEILSILKGEKKYE